MGIFLRIEDYDRVIANIREDMQKLMDKLNTPGTITITEKEQVIKDITSVTSRIDIADQLPTAIKTFALQHNIAL